LDLVHAALVNNAIEDSTHKKIFQSENAVYAPLLWMSTLPFSQDLSEEQIALAKGYWKNINVNINISCSTPM